MPGRRGKIIGLAAVVVAVVAVAPAAQAATIEPDVLFDDLATTGNCTLREAVEAATTNTAVDECPKGQLNKADKILLAEGEYPLDTGDDDNNVVGDLDIAGGGRVNIVGKGMAKTSIDGPATDRGLQLFVDSGNGPTQVGLKKLYLDGGSAGLNGGVITAQSGFDGKLILDKVKVQNGEAQFGGGVYITSGRLQVKRSVFENNDARVDSTGFPNVRAVGGALHVTSIAGARVSDSAFIDNSAITNDSQALGGAISEDSSGGTVVRRSYFSSNDAFSSSNDTSSIRQGGAIYGENHVRVINSTFFLNRAFGTGAAAKGGAYYGATGDAEFVHSTFLDNGATTGSALTLEDGTLKVSRSVFEPGTGSGLCQVLGGAFKSKGYNVALGPFGCDLDGKGDKLADPLLDAPEDNGGLTETLKLKKGSPAIDRIPAKKCKPAEGEDQRRYKRPAGKRCDSGAYERGAKKR